MRKMINLLIFGAILGGSSALVTGCGDQSGTSKEVPKITNPDGTPIKLQREMEVPKGGKNVPAGPSRR